MCIFWSSALHPLPNAAFEEHFPRVFEQSDCLRQVFATGAPLVYDAYCFTPFNVEDGRVAAVLCTALSAGRSLAEQLIGLTTVQEACERAVQYFRSFACIYLLEGGKMHLAAANCCSDSELAPSELREGAPWPFLKALASSEVESVNVLTRPVSIAGLRDSTGRAMGVLIVGGPLSASTACTISKGIAAAAALEAEKRRADQLAQLDVSRTAFFANVSHEFRTPLTLILGPLEDLLARADPAISATYEEVDLVYRNAARLLKLVNSLLDFTRIEAGRMQAVYEPVQLGTFTCDLASAFRSAIERAGVRLIVRCRELPEPVWVDREMWETLVLNLVSNAFKFTLEGTIEVVLEASDDEVTLTVRDTGLGIPAADLPHIFDKFHRVQDSGGRTREGTGIGLALVKELAKLHGGDVQVESVLGEGSTFRVTIPRGRRHLPAEQTRVANSSRAEAYVAEVQKSLLNDLPEPSPHGRRARVLVADDNADMREYLRRLLSERYEVEVVANGKQALAAIARSRPNLILTDAVMPHLDGFGLLREVRGSRDTSAIPVILLSARAGGEARVDGLQAGADDYLVKPFTARELLARVSSNIELSRVRETAAMRERALREEAEAAREAVVQTLESISDAFLAIDDHWRLTYLNHHAERMSRMSRQSAIGRSIRDVFPAAKNAVVESEFNRALAERVAVEFETQDGARWYGVRAFPTPDGGLSVFYSDVTERRMAQEALKHTNQALQWANADLERFVYSATHDLQEPLRAVVIYSRLLSQRAAQLDAESRVHLQYCVQGASRLDALIRHLLIYSQTNAHPGDTAERISLSDAFNVAATKLKGMADETGATIRCAGLPEVGGKSAHFELIFEHLLKNALLYRSAQAPAIDVAAERCGNDWVISVRDNGIGIDSRYHNQIFEMFQRLHTAQQYPGTGIGLTLCRKLIDRYNGRVWVESRLGEGATFRFTMPVMEHVLVGKPG